MIKKLKDFVKPKEPIIRRRLEGKIVIYISELIKEGDCLTL